MYLIVRLFAESNGCPFFWFALRAKQKVMSLRWSFRANQWSRVRWVRWLSPPGIKLNSRVSAMWSAVPEAPLVNVICVIIGATALEGRLTYGKPVWEPIWGLWEPFWGFRELRSEVSKKPWRACLKPQRGLLVGWRRELGDTGYRQFVLCGSIGHRSSPLLPKK